MRYSVSNEEKIKSLETQKIFLQAGFSSLSSFKSTKTPIILHFPTTHFNTNHWRSHQWKILDISLTV